MIVIRHIVKRCHYGQTAFVKEKMSIVLFIGLFQLFPTNHERECCQ